MRAIVIDDETLVAVSRYLEPLYDHVEVATTFADAWKVLERYPKANLVVSGFFLDRGRTAWDLAHLFSSVGRLVLMSAEPNRIPPGLVRRASKVISKPFGLGELDALLP